LIGPTLVHNFGRQTCLIFSLSDADAASFIFQTMIQHPPPFSILICSLNGFVIRKNVVWLIEAIKSFTISFFEVATNLGKQSTNWGSPASQLFSLHKKVILGNFKSSSSRYIFALLKKISFK
jgi:hypothetical protein